MLPFQGFEKSDFYQHYSALLSNKILLDTLKRNKYKITFVLHPGLRQYANYFKKFETDSVFVVSDPTVSYRELFNTSALMITDYSSVFFDFVYLKKPCIFYQFDRKDFFEKHYKEGEFKFDTMAPGRICKTEQEVVKMVIWYLNNNMQMQPEYLKRLKDIYINHDAFNSHRVIKDLLKND